MAVLFFMMSISDREQDEVSSKYYVPYHTPRSHRNQRKEGLRSNYLLSVLAVGVISPGCSVVLAQSWACKLTVGKVCTGTVSTATMSGWLDLFSTSSEESQVMLGRI